MYPTLPGTKLWSKNVLIGFVLIYQTYLLDVYIEELVFIYGVYYGMRQWSQILI